MSKFYAAFYIDLEDAEFLGLAVSWDDAKAAIIAISPEYVHSQITHWTQVHTVSDKDDKAPVSFLCAVRRSLNSFYTQYVIVECEVGQKIDFRLTTQSAGWQRQIDTDSLIPINP